VSIMTQQQQLTRREWLEARKHIISAIERGEVPVDAARRQLKQLDDTWFNFATYPSNASAPAAD